MRMSPIVRWRSGETLGVNELMVQLQSKSEADRLTRQLGRIFSATNSHRVVEEDGLSKKHLTGQTGSR